MNLANGHWTWRTSESSGCGDTPSLFSLHTSALKGRAPVIMIFVVIVMNRLPAELLVFGIAA